MPSRTRSTQRTSRASSRGSPVISMRTYIGPTSVSRARTGSTSARSSPRALARSNRAAPARNRWAQYPPRPASSPGGGRRPGRGAPPPPRGWGGELVDRGAGGPGGEGGGRGGLDARGTHPGAPPAGPAHRLARGLHLHGGHLIASHFALFVPYRY